MALANASSSTHAYTDHARLSIITNLLAYAEHSGRRISSQVQGILENECSGILERSKSAFRPHYFASTLKETAVRLFRQRRYREADRRYRMASLFNPEDVTLLSNRAVCMYNLRRYKRCIELCMHSITTFPQLSSENSLLFFKVLLRIARAHIELGNFADAQIVAQAVINTRSNLSKSFNLQFSQAVIDDMMAPYQKHFDAAVAKFKKRHPDASIPDQRSTHFRLSIGVNGYVHHDIQFSDVGESDDDSPNSDGSLEDIDTSENDEDLTEGVSFAARPITICELCPHVYSGGIAVCSHDEEYGKPFALENRSFYNVRGPGNLPQSASDNITELRRGDSRTRSNCISANAIVMEDSNEDDCDSGAPCNDSSADENVLDTSEKNPLLVNTDHAPSSSDSHERCGHCCAQPDYQGLMEISAKTQERSLASLLLIKRFDDLISKSPMSLGTSNILRLESEVSVSSKYGCDSGKASYESDNEEVEAVSIFVNDKACRNYSDIPDADMNEGYDSISQRCLKDVFGESFLAQRKPVFVKLFGSHKKGSTSRRKSPRCADDCGTCFAEKMWNSRFTNVNHAVANNFISTCPTDPRRDDSLFLCNSWWAESGYYASGHEMAWDLPALIHGMAFAVILQSELQWRGDYIPLSVDVERNFLKSLQKHSQDEEGLKFLTDIIIQFQETLLLIGCLNKHKANGYERSFQFSATSADVANAAWNSLGVGSTSDSSNMNYIHWMTRSTNCFLNMHNWGKFGNVSKAEEAAYKFLFNGIRALFVLRTERGSRYLSEPHNANAFYKHFPGLSSENDNEQWKSRGMLLLVRKRSRELELAAWEESGHSFETNCELLSRAIKARPRQPRLYFKRARLRWDQGKGNDCLIDLRTARRLLRESDTISKVSNILNSKQILLLFHIYMLEGDALMQLAEKPSQKKLQHLRTAKEALKKAILLPCTKKKQKAMIHRKIRLISSQESKLNEPTQSHENKSLVESCSVKKAIALSEGKRSLNNDRYCPVSKSKDEKTANSSEGKRSLNKDIHCPIEHKTSASPYHRNRRMPTEDSFIEVEESSSSSEDERVGMLSGNPYSVLMGKEDDKQARANGVGSSASHARGATGSQRRNGETLESPKNVPSQRSLSSQECIPSLKCSVCQISFGDRRVEYDNHMRGKRHRQSVARARRNLVSGEITPSLPDRPGQTRNISQEALVKEIRQIIVRCGGKAKLLEVSQALDLSQWGIPNPMRYIQRHFEGLFNFCLNSPSNFNILADSGLDSTVILTDRSESVTCTNRDMLSRIRSQACLGDSHNHLLHTRHTPSAAGGLSTGWSTVITGSQYTQMTHDMSQARASTSNGEAQSSVANANLLSSSNSGTGPKKSPSSNLAASPAYDEMECKICMDNQAELRCQPCGHSWCEDCIMGNIARKRYDCPYCRCQITAIEELKR